jgi:hypothetical protein
VALYQSWGKPEQVARYQAALSPASGTPPASRTP